MLLDGVFQHNRCFIGRLVVDSKELPSEIVHYLRNGCEHVFGVQEMNRAMEVTHVFHHIARLQFLAIFRQRYLAEITF